jgi:hypothetical protein
MIDSMIVISTIFAFIMFVIADTYTTVKASAMEGFFELIPFTRTILKKVGWWAFLLEKLAAFIVFVIVGIFVSNNLDSNFYSWLMGMLGGAGMVALLSNSLSIRQMNKLNKKW